jgi:hypothetical protein
MLLYTTMSDSPSDSYEGEKRIYIHQTEEIPPPPATAPRRHNNSDNDDDGDVSNSENQLMFCTGHVTDRRLWILCLQSIISLLIISLCCFKLFDENLTCEQGNLYVGLITLITGIWMKSPID